MRLTKTRILDRVFSRIVQSIVGCTVRCQTRDQSSAMRCRGQIEKATNLCDLWLLKVGLTGFEPATSTTPRWRASQAALQPDCLEGQFVARHASACRNVQPRAEMIYPGKTDTLPLHPIEFNSCLRFYSTRCDMHVISGSPGRRLRA